LRQALKVGAVLTISVGILGGIILAVGLEETWDAVARAGFLAFGAVGLLTCAQLVLQAWAWKSLNRGVNHQVRYRTLLSAVISGMAVNIVTPSAYLGGEPIKVIFVARKTGLPMHEVAGTVLLSKFLEVLSFLLIFGSCVVVTLVEFRDVLFSSAYLSAGIMVILVTVILLALSVTLWLGLYRGWKPLTALVGGLRRYRRGSRFLARLFDRTARMEKQVARVYHEKRETAVKAFAKLFLSHLTIFAKPAAFFALGSWSGLSFGELSLIFVAGQALAGFQFTPSGVGTLDGGLIGTFALLGLAEPTCMAFLLSLRFWDAVMVGAGAFLGARAGARLFETRATAPRSTAAMIEAENDARKERTTA